MRGYRVLKPNKKYEIPEDKKERYLNRMIIIDALLVVSLLIIFFIVK